MKKLLSFLVLGGALVMLASCRKDKDDDFITSPQDAQEYLAETGMQLAEMIDHDLKYPSETDDLFAYLIAKYRNFDASQIDMFINSLEKQIRTETYKEDYVTNAPVRLLESVRECAATGTRAYMRTLLHVITYNISMPQFYGGIKADDANGTFILDPTVRDRMEITLYDRNSKPVVLTLKGSEKTTKISIISTVHENSFREGHQTENLTRTNQYFVDVPETITLDAVHEGKTLVGIKINSSLALDFNAEMSSDETVEQHDGRVEYVYNDYYNNFSIDYTKLNIDGEMTDADGYTAKFGSSADAQGIGLNAHLNKGSQQVFSIDASLKGNMALIPELIKNADNSSVSEEQALGMLSLLGYKADAGLKLLDRVEVKADCSNIGELLKAVAQVEGALEEGKGEAAVKSAMGNLNAQLNSGLYLAGSKKKTAHLEIDCVRDSEEESGFAFEPVLVFDKDGSRFGIEEFFSAECFNEVSAAFIDIIMQIAPLLGI